MIFFLFWFCGRVFGSVMNLNIIIGFLFGVIFSDSWDGWSVSLLICDWKWCDGVGFVW